VSDGVRRRRVLSWFAAAITVAALSACSDESPDDVDTDSGTGDADTPGGVGGTELVDPAVPASNVPNQPESPMDPGQPNSS
jgi:hypothetical protein